MKTVSIIIMLIIKLSIINAQERCKYLHDKVDDFTKERIVSTDYKSIYVQGKGKHIAASIVSTATGSGVSGRKEEMFFNASNIGGKNLLGMRVRSTDRYSTYYGSYYLMLLTNEEVVKIWRIDAGNWGSYFSYSDDASWSSFLLGVDSIGWAKMKKYGVKKIRIPEQDKYNYHDIEINPKNYEVIKEVINCIDVLAIEKVHYEVDNDPVNATNSSTETKQGVVSNAPVKLLNKKWRVKDEIDDPRKKGAKMQFENIIEYKANGEMVTESIMDGKTHTFKGTYELANDGKYIVAYIKGGEPQTSEIVSIQDKVLILKGVDGKVYVFNAD